ncbi:beta strand repeat-containing protein, partial [Haemophilus parahaemolyticus]
KGTKDNGELIKPSNTVEMIAGKNLTVKQDESGKVTYATKGDVEFNTVQIGGSEGPKFSATTDGNISVSDKDGTNPVKMTNVKVGDVSATSKDAINGSQFHGLAKNTIKLAGQNGTAAATETDGQELDTKGGIKFTVKSSDGALLDVTAAGDTITLTPKTGTITTTGGVPTATTTNGNLVTAEQVVNTLKEIGWKATAGKDGTGTVADASVELIKAGETVTFKAGNNLAIKQAGKEFIYSLQKELTGLTSAEFKDANNNAVKITPEGITITKPADATGANGKTVTLNQDGLDNGGNAITNVASNLPNTQNSSTANTAAAPSDATKSQAAPTLGTGANQVNPNNAATVGDVLNAGWNLQGNGAEVDFVKAYDTVDFVNGDGTTASVESKDGKTSTVKYSVNLGDGLEKTGDNKIKAKAGNGVTVGADGIKVNTGKGLKIDAADNNKVAVDTDGTTITVGNDGKVTAVTGSTEAVTADNKTGTEKVGQVRSVATNKDKLATVDTVVQAVNSAKWIAKATNTGVDIEDADKTNDSATTGADIAAGDEVTFTAGKNLRVNREGKNFTFATAKDVSFDSVKVGKDDAATGKKPVNLTTEAAKGASNNDDANKPTTALNISSGTGTDAKPTQLVGVGSVLNKTTINTTPTGTVPAGSTPTTADLVNLTEAVNKNAAATVGDLQNMGWKVSSDKVTGADGAYLDVVKNANEVKFVGTGTAIVSGKTDAATGIRTITVAVDDQVSTNNAVTPVVYTKADGTKVYPVKNAHGDIEYHTTPDGKGANDETVDGNNVITSVNGPKGATTPTTLSNVASNLPNTQNSSTANTAAAPSDATKSQAAPTLGTGANQVNPNNAAT